MKTPQAPKGYHYTPEGMMSNNNPIFKKARPLNRKQMAQPHSKAMPAKSISSKIKTRKK